MPLVAGAQYKVINRPLQVAYRHNAVQAITNVLPVGTVITCIDNDFYASTCYTDIENKTRLFAVQQSIIDSNSPGLESIANGGRRKSRRRNRKARKSRRSRH
jgi:hypothetical protein